MLFVFLLFLACASANTIKLVNNDLELTPEGKEFLGKLGSEPVAHFVLEKTQTGEAVESESAGVYVSPAPVVDAKPDPALAEQSQQIKQLEEQLSQYKKQFEELEQQKSQHSQQRTEQVAQQAKFEAKIKQLEETGKSAQQVEKLVSDATKVYTDSVTGKVQTASTVNAFEKIHEESNNAALSSYQTAATDVSPALAEEGLKKLNANIAASRGSFTQIANAKWSEVARNQLQSLWVAEMKELEATPAVYEKAKTEVKKKFEEATKGLPSKLTTGSWNDYLTVIESDPVRQTAFVATAPADAVLFSLFVLGFHFVWTHIKSRFPRVITIFVALVLMPAVIGSSLFLVSELGYASVENIPGMTTFVPIATSLGHKLSEKLPLVCEFTEKYTAVVRPHVEESLKAAQKHFATVKPALDKFSADAQAFAASVPVHAEAALTSAKKYAETATPIITTYYEKASTTVGDLAKSAQPAAENFIASAKINVEKLSASAKPAAENFIASAKINVEKLSASAKPAVENFVASAQPALAGLADSAKAFVGTATEKVNKIIADLTKKEL